MRPHDLQIPSHKTNILDENFITRTILALNHTWTELCRLTLPLNYCKFAIVLYIFVPFVRLSITAQIKRVYYYYYYYYYYIRITHSRCRPRGALTCNVHLQSKLKDVGNQEVGLPDILPSMGSSKPPYRQLRFRQDLNHKVWFMATTKDRMEFRQCRGLKVDVWLGTSPAQTLWLQVISTVQFMVQELLPQTQKHWSQPSTPNCLLRCFLFQSRLRLSVLLAKRRPNSCQN